MKDTSDIYHLLKEILEDLHSIEGELEKLNENVKELGKKEGF